MCEKQSIIGTKQKRVPIVKNAHKKVFSWYSLQAGLGTVTNCWLWHFNLIVGDNSAISVCQFDKVEYIPECNLISASNSADNDAALYVRTCEAVWPRARDWELQCTLWDVQFIPLSTILILFNSYVLCVISGKEEKLKCNGNDVELSVWLRRGIVLLKIEEKLEVENDVNIGKTDCNFEVKFASVIAGEGDEHVTRGIRLSKRKMIVTEKENERNMMRGCLLSHMIINEKQVKKIDTIITKAAWHQ